MRLHCLLPRLLLFLRPLKLLLQQQLPHYLLRQTREPRKYIDLLNSRFAISKVIRIE
jgi:hypothetical protein